MTQRIKRYNLPLTYTPKIPGVLAGTIVTEIRRAVADIDPSHSRDRDHYRILQEIYDAVGEIYDIRSAKLRMAVQDRAVFRRDVDRPENLTEEEQERYDMAISLGGHNAE